MSRAMRLLDPDPSPAGSVAQIDGAWVTGVPALAHETRWRLHDCEDTPPAAESDTRDWSEPLRSPELPVGPRGEARPTGPETTTHRTDPTP